MKARNLRLMLITCNYFLRQMLLESKQVPAFLSLIGPKLFGLVKDLVSPKAPKECSMNELVEVLNNHYKPQVIVIYERFKFYRRRQEPHETVASFIASLKSLVATCDFGDRLEEMLRDKLVMGLEEESTQRILLTEKKLTFARAVEIANAREAAERDVREFGQKPSSGSKDVNSVKSSNTKSNFQKKKGSLKQKPKQGEKGNKPDKPCSGCGKNHWKADCPFKDSECFTCKRRGHISKVCFTKNKPSSQPASEKSVGSVESTSKPMSEPTGELASEYNFSTSSTGSGDLYYVTLNLNGSADVHFQVDSGAARTLMSEQEFRKSFPMAAPKIMPSRTELKRYGGSKIPVCGEIAVKIYFRQRILENQTILIVKDSGPSLLGRDLLPALGII